MAPPSPPPDRRVGEARATRVELFYEVLQAGAEASEEAQARRYALACLLDDVYLRLQYLPRNVGAEVTDGVAYVAEAAGWVKRQGDAAPVPFGKRE